MLLAALALFCVVGFASLLGAPAGDNPSDIFTDITVKDKPILLRNNVGQDKPWVGLQLKGTKSNRDGIGAKLALQAGGRCMVRWVTGGGSYLSSQDRRVLFGLGAGPAVYASQVASLAGLPYNEQRRLVEVHRGR